MSQNTIYLITGANRGIGLGLTASLLERPNSTVIATVRDKEVTDCSSLRALPLAENSKLVIETLCASTSPPTSGSDSGLAVEQALLAALTNIHGIKHIDTIIANAGTGTMFSPILNSSPESLLSNFSVNTLSPIFLFQTLHPLLSLSKSPKYIAITSMLGSISLQSPQAGPTLAYGISKAGLNFFVRKLHFEIPELVALAIHPGWVKTGNGQAFADAVGVPEPPLTIEESVEGVLHQIDIATKETTSGTFISYDGTAIGY